MVARLESIDLLLPVRLDATTAVAFHPVDNRNSVALTPVGQPGDTSGVSGPLADLFAHGGLRYFMTGGDASDASSATAGLDVGAVPGAFVYSPVDGRVIAVTVYQLLGRYTDDEIELQLDDDPSLLLTLGRLCIQQQLWGKAQSYLEASLALQPSITANIQLAKLLEQLGHTAEANRLYRAAALLAV